MKKHISNFENFNELNFLEEDKSDEQIYNEAFDSYEKALIELKKFKSNINDTKMLFDKIGKPTPSGILIADKFILRNFRNISNEIEKDINLFKL